MVASARGQRSRSLEFERSTAAHQEIGQWSHHWRKEAATRVKSLPVEVRSNGLALAVAVLLREDEPASRALAEMLSKWLLDQCGLPIFARQKTATSPLALIEALVSADRSTARLAQEEALAYLDVVKLLAAVL